MAKLISAGPFVTEGEKQAADLLRRLPADWIVIANKTIVRDSARSYEVDFVVIGSNWIFVIDEKSWWGKIEGNKQNWTLSSGEIRPNPLNKVEMICKILADEVKAGVPELKDAPKFCRGAILLSLTDQSPDINDPRASDAVYIRGNILKRLPEVDSIGGSTGIGMQRAAIEKVLGGLEDRTVLPSEIGAYHIEEELPGRPGCRILRATIQRTEERTLMMYDLGKDPIAAEELRAFYLREFNALSRLQKTGVVPQVFDPFPWSDDFLVLPIAPVRGHPIHAYPPPETAESFVDELALAAASFRALAVIHAHQIIHRAIGPGSVFVMERGHTPKIALGNFYAARTDATSIAPSLDALSIEDPYASSELAAGYSWATPASDCHSLGLVFLERFSRVPVTELRSSSDYSIDFPDLRAVWKMLPPKIVDELSRLIRPILDGQLDAASAANAFEDFARQFRSQEKVEQGRVLDNRYQVLRILGHGATARTYLARDKEFDGVFALKQYLWPSAVMRHAKAEFEVLRRISSPRLPRVYDVFPPGNDVHVKMDYIPGPTLDAVKQEFPWPVDQWWSFAQDMLDALQVLEEHHLLHRDVKPANIILQEDDGRPVLIDFGLAVRLGVETTIAGAPLYLPPEATSTVEPPPSSDRYALAVILYQVLTGGLPFEETALGLRRVFEHLPELDAQARRIATVLLRAVSHESTERPSSILEFRKALQYALLAGNDPVDEVDLPELTNFWVNEIRSLYRNSDIGNANNRGLDTDFVRQTYISTDLDNRLLPAVLSRLPKLVFLSGNPGDGKTAFLEQVSDALQAQGAIPVWRDASGWEWEFKGHRIRSCYDASEANGFQSADEQLTAKLEGLEGDDEPTCAVTALVAINDGRLADFFARHRNRFGWLNDQIDLSQRHGNSLTADVWLVDLKERSFVSLTEDATPSVFQRVLMSFVAPEHWAICSDCSAKSGCPIYNNALALHQEVVRERLEYLLVLSHLRRLRHITMRDLRSALAYLITSNMNCEQVHAARRGDDIDVALIDRAYWRLVFAPHQPSDDLVEGLAPLDPGRFPQPGLDRFLHSHRSMQDANLRKRLFFDGRDLLPQQFSSERLWLEAMKRRLYFEHTEKSSVEDGVPIALSATTLLPYRYAPKLIQMLTRQIEPADLMDVLARAFLRSDHVASLETPGKFSIVVSQSFENRLIVLKQFPVTDFRLVVNRQSGSDLIETIAEFLILEHRDGNPRLEITLDLFELLLRLANGLLPSAPEFQPLLEDLKPFKSALLLKQAKDLVLVENQRQFHYVTQRAGKIVRETATRKESA